MQLEEVNKALNQFAKDVVIGAKREITRQGKGGGNLSKLLDYDLNASKNSFYLEFLGADYMDFVDRGVSGKERRYDTPYRFTNKMPPRKEILKWVNKKRMRLKDDKGRFVKNGQNSLAFLIQRSIFKKGLKPSLFFTKPFEKHFKKLPKELEIAYALDIEDFIDYTFKQRRNGTNS